MSVPSCRSIKKYLYSLKRKIDLNEFQDTETALSTVELITRLGKFMNKTTIYRILEKLEDDGTLKSLGETFIPFVQERDSVGRMFN